MKLDKLKAALMEDESPKMKHDKNGLSAKMDVLRELSEMMSKKAGDDVESGLRSVKVAAPDKDGLKKGLDLAAGLMDKTDGEMPEGDDIEDMIKEDMPDAEVMEVDSDDMMMDDMEADPKEISEDDDGDDMSDEDKEMMKKHMMKGY